jgi:large subunit ribosomal protein L20
MRVKGGNKRLLRRKKILELAKGFKGKRRTCFRIAKERVMHALRNAYISRKLRKRDFRRLWNIRINAAARARGLPYSRFINGLAKAGVKLNRKMLAEIAIRDPKTFDVLVERAKAQLARSCPQ